MTRPLALFSAALSVLVGVALGAMIDRAVFPQIPEYTEPVQSWCNAAEVRKATWVSVQNASILPLDEAGVGSGGSHGLRKVSTVQDSSSARLNRK